MLLQPSLCQPAQIPPITFTLFYSTNIIDKCVVILLTYVNRNILALQKIYKPDLGMSRMVSPEKLFYIEVITYPWHICNIGGKKSDLLHITGKKTKH